MEVVQVQPRDSYLHYVYVPTKNTTINWSFTTKRNNIQFGVYKRHGQEPLPSSSDILFRAQAHRQGSLPSGELLNPQGSSKDLLASSAGSINSVHSSTTSRPRAKFVAFTKLREQGLVEIVPIQQTNSSQTKVEGSLMISEAGNYVLVFDNTFSRNTPKLLTLSVTLSETPTTGLDRGSSIAGGETVTANGSSANQYELTGWLLKKRRKKMQGWAKRWFRLSGSGVLSYSTSPTGVPRGLIQIRISTITNQPKSRALHIDSGTMIYHLKALTPEDHETWTKHLKKHRASGLETEVESFEEWRYNRQSRHASAVAKEKARVDVSRGLQGSQNVKEKLQCLDKWLQEEKEQYDVEPGWITRLVQLKDDLEGAINRQDQQWHVIQETVVQADLFNLGRASGNSTPLSTIADAHGTADSSTSSNGLAGLRRTTTMMSHDSSFSEEFYDAEDVELSPSEEDNDADGHIHVEEAADTTDDEEDEEEDSENEQEQEDKQGTHQEEKDWTQQWLDSPQRRHRLPSPAVGDVGSALSVFRKNVGKDLSTIAMPVSMNEPLNMLQKACEELEYSDLLDKACTLLTPMERLMYITVFAITSYTSSQYRTGRKPFNPMMTETYENIRPDKGFRFISEKVSHNPLIIAAHAESKNYKYWQCTKIKSKFWGKSMEFMTEGVFHVNLTGHDDHYTYSKPSSWMRNMIAGEKYLEHAGEMKVMNHTTGDYAISHSKKARAVDYSAHLQIETMLLRPFTHLEGKK
ncbi:unnamed protein product [Absidia cylindrospora]